MAVKQSISGFCPHMQKNYIIAVWFRDLKRPDGQKIYEKQDFECNEGYRGGCGLINACPIYGAAEYTER